MPAPLTHQVQELVATVLALARSRTGKLVALTVAGPPSTPAAEVLASLQEQLSKEGMGNVTVAVRPVAGPLRVLSAEFER